ncbi:MAG: DMT family transporter [Pseudomonadota bacterium]|nr:DMT family transporter [Pseudomonadota bacterium]
MQATESKHQDHVLRGMLAAIAAFFLFSIMAVCAKLLSERHSVIEIAFYRNLIGTLPFLFLIFVLGKREILIIKSRPAVVGFRAVLGAVSLTTTFAAFSIMPMAETTVLLFTASLFIPVLGVFVLGERVGPYRWAAVFIGFAGVVVMASPAGNLNTLGIAIALTASLMHAVLQVVLRYLGKFESPETVTFYFMVIGTLITALPLPFIAVTPTLDEIPLLFGLGLTGAAAQWFLSVAFRNAPAAVVTVFNYTGIVWAMLFGWMIFNDWPAPLVLLGAAIVIGSNVLMVWREIRLGKVTGARVRAKF